MRRFNVTGACDPKLHYMVDISERLAQIKKLVDDGYYFTVNRARQYGKTTTIKALTEYLKDDYIVLSLDFQRLGNEEFQTETTFSKAFAWYLCRIARNKRIPIVGLDEENLKQMDTESETDGQFTLSRLFGFLSDMCDTAERPVVLIIDEVDSATNNQVFLDFLAQLRNGYLDRANMPTFHSVILAGVTDVKNMKMKLRPDSGHKVNSPWNIAADFLLDMSFDQSGIKGMLEQYEADHHTGMDTTLLAGLFYDATSSYPFLVSRLCQLIDERIAGTDAFLDEAAAWTREGFLEAERMLLMEKNTLFESLMGKLYDYPKLNEMVQDILFARSRIVYNPDEYWMDVAMMFGFVKNENGALMIANRVFEMRLYNYFLA